MYTTLDKTLVAALMGVIGLLNYVFPGLHIGLSGESINALIVTVTPLIVYLWPNAPKDA